MTFCKVLSTIEVSKGVGVLFVIHEFRYHIISENPILGLIGDTTDYKAPQ